MNETDTALYWLFGVLAVAFLSAFLVGIVQFGDDFSRELRYLNLEIGRTEGAERKFWIRRRRRLWLSLIPFVRY